MKDEAEDEVEEIEPVEEDDCIIIADEPVNSSPPPPPVPTDPFLDALQILQLTMDEVFEGSRMHGKEDCSKNTDCWPGRCTLTVEAQPRTYVETLKQMRWCSKILLLGWMSIVASLYMWKSQTPFRPQRCVQLYQNQKACRRCLWNKSVPQAPAACFSVLAKPQAALTPTGFAGLERTTSTSSDQMPTRQKEDNS